ncbi:MAG: zinc ribbon domain-containing protein [Pirellulales bacterium]|nr:zinc ribbon domain-containing protein [Pirellulales bacterium]
MPQPTHHQPTVDDDAPVVRARACAHCGAPADPQDRFCNACGMEQAAGTVRAPAMPQRYFRCENCGASVWVDPDQRSYGCAFCDSTYVVEFSPQQTDRQEPEFVIGFAVTPEQAMEKFRTWFRQNGWFRPGDLRMAQVENKLKGVYLPFWSFSMLAESRWAASIGEFWYRTETYTTRENGKNVTKTRTVRETEWWPLAGNHHSYYSGYLVSGSRGLSQPDADRIKPFHLPALRRYVPYFLAGWLCEEYSVRRDEAMDVCRQEFSRQEQAAVAAFLPGDTYSDLRVDTEFSRINSDLVLLPIYLLSYRYQDTLYRFLVNGQTGKVAGDKPLSWLKILVPVAVAAVLVLVLVLLFGLSK